MDSQKRLLTGQYENDPIFFNPLEEDTAASLLNTPYVSEGENENGNLSQNNYISPSQVQDTFNSILDSSFTKEYLAQNLNTPNSSFNFSELLNNASELSQETGLTPEIPLSQNPRYLLNHFQQDMIYEATQKLIREDAYLGSTRFSPDSAYGTPTTPGVTIKVERASDIMAPLLTDSQGSFFNLESDNKNEVDFRNSSQESSQGVRLPVVDSWPGNYNFTVWPDQRASKKCVYLEQMDKIFILDFQDILFNVYLDFENAPLKNLKIEAMLICNLPESLLENVIQCEKCHEREMKNVYMNNKGPRGTGTGIGYVIRCSNYGTKYLMRPSGQHVTVSPLEKPQPGTRKILRNFTFTCKNSCRGSLEKRNLKILFSLIEGNNVVGRHSYDIRICSSPQRDAHLENEKRLKKERKSLGGGEAEGEIEMKRGADENISPSPKKTEPPVSMEELEKEQIRSAKQGRFSEQNFNNDLPGPSTLAYDNRSCSQFSQDYGCDTDSENFFSQDSQKITKYLSGIVRDISKIHSHREHPNPIYKQYVDNIFMHIKLVRAEIKYYMTHVINKNMGEKDIPLGDERKTNDSNTQSADEALLYNESQSQSER